MIKAHPYLPPTGTTAPATTATPAPASASASATLTASTSGQTTSAPDGLTANMDGNAGSSPHGKSSDSADIPHDRLTNNTDSEGDTSPGSTAPHSGGSAISADAHPTTTASSSSGGDANHQAGIAATAAANASLARAFAALPNQQKNQAQHSADGTNAAAAVDATTSSSADTPGHPRPASPPSSASVSSSVSRPAAIAATAVSYAPPPPPPPPNFFTFHPPSYYLNFSLPQDAILVGDCHLTRGDLTVIGGVAGCGKSRLLVSLAIAGKQGPGATWMGLDVHASFKTAILQAENGEVRLQRELQDIHDQGHDLDGWLYLTPPPPFGLAFSAPAFRDQLRDWIAEVQPGVLAIDPWNRCVGDDKAKDYRIILDAVYEVLPEGPAKPAIVIIHHLRKQTGGDNTRRRGRDLLNELSGSYVIGSASRVTFILEPATPDGEDDRVLFTCAKNNNGDMGKPTAWHRKNGLFVACDDFDWEEYGSGGKTAAEPPRSGVSLSSLCAIFQNGERSMSKVDVVANLHSLHNVSRTNAYNALKPQGPFAAHLAFSKGLLHFSPDPAVKPPLAGQPPEQPDLPVQPEARTPAKSPAKAKSKARSTANKTVKAKGGPKAEAKAKAQAKAKTKTGAVA